LGIDDPDSLPDRLDLELSDILGRKALRLDVAHLDRVEVDQLQPLYADGRKVQGDLASAFQINSDSAASRPSPGRLHALADVLALSAFLPPACHF
jgi:hypothetical protein